MSKTETNESGDLGQLLIGLGFTLLGAGLITSVVFAHAIVAFLLSSGGLGFLGIVAVSSLVAGVYKLLTEGSDILIPIIAFLLLVTLSIILLNIFLPVIAADILGGLGLLSYPIVFFGGPLFFTGVLFSGSMSAIYGLATVVTNSWIFIKDLASNILSFIRNLPTNIWSFMKDLPLKIWSFITGISSNISNAFKAIKSFFIKSDDDTSATDQRPAELDTIGTNTNLEPLLPVTTVDTPTGGTIDPVIFKGPNTATAESRLAKDAVSTKSDITAGTPA